MPLLLNGTITLGYKAGSDEPDEYGMPQSVMTWSEPIQCMYKAITDDKRGQYTDGQFQRSAYDVHIDTSVAPADVFKAKQAKLVSLEGIELGTMTVQSVTPIRLLPRIAFSLGV